MSEPPASLAEVLVVAAAARPASPFLVDPEGRALTYGQFDDNVAAWATELSSLGLTAGGRLALICVNRIEFFFAAFAAWRLGAIVVPIAHEQRGAILGSLLSNAGPALVLVDEPGHAALMTIPVAAAPRPDAILSVARRPSSSAGVAWRRIDPETPALIMYSSGTTGISKGCVLSHGYMALAGRDFCRAVDMSPTDSLYSAGPFSHLNAWWAFAGAVVGGVKLTFDRRFSASRFWDQVEATGATLFDYVGAMIAILLRRPDGPGTGCRLRAGVGGAARAEEMRMFGQRFGIPLLECYGLTECCLPIFQRERELRAGSIGKLADCVDARIVDEAGCEVGDGARGELWLRALDPRAMFSGYWRRDDLTAAAFNGPWFRTGDICWRDTDGYFYYVDRRKHFIRRRGENISAFEVEGVVFDHPAVANCAVIGVPADLGEEDVLLAVQPKPQQIIDPDELLAWCAEKMAAFMVPRYVRVMSDLPLTPSERVEKQKLRETGVTEDTFDRAAGGRIARGVRALAMRQVGRPEALRLQDLDAPGAGDVEVAVELVPISIAEVRAVRGDRFKHFGQTIDPAKPFVFGFTGVGRVTASRAEAITTGARVVLSGLASCGRCRYCKAGLENHCEQLRLAGIDVDSPGYARSRVIVPARRVFPMPAGMRSEIGCVVSEVATAIHCLHRVGLRAGESVGVVGAGRHGRQIVRVAKRWGARVVAFDPSELARRLAMAAGADIATDARGLGPAERSSLALDVVVHANSVEESLADCCDVAAPGGRVALLGTPGGLSVRLPGFAQRVLRKRLAIYGSDSKNPESFVEAIALMAQGEEDWDIRRPRVLCLSQAPQALLDAARQWPPDADLFIDLSGAGDVQ